MALSKEELLQPRYKVIADYPDNPFEVGQLLPLIQQESIWCFVEESPNSKWVVPESDLQDYPHLFRRLEWWEERAVEDMPEYLKCTERLTGRAGVFHVQWKRKWGVLQVANHGTNFWHPLERYENPAPATQSEYEAFLAK